MTDRNAHRSRRRSLAAHAHATAPRPLRLEPLEDRRLLAIDFELLKDIDPRFYPGSAEIHEIVDVGGVAYYNATDGVHGDELWRSDGTADGTYLVKDIRTGAEGSSPNGLLEAGGKLYFVADDGVSGLELWRSDGTEAGTIRLTDLIPSLAVDQPTQLTEVNGALFFVADDGGTGGRTLWTTDGTVEGTRQVRSIGPPGAESPLGLFGELENVDGVLFFAAADLRGVELWKTDGTAAGTVLVKDIAVSPGSPFTSSSPRSLTNLDGTLFFTAGQGAGGFVGLWKSDGTAEGTVPASTAANPQDIQQLTAVGSTLFFVGWTTLLGHELYKYDPVTESTSLVREIRPGSSNTSIASLTAVGGQLFFTAQDGVSGRELWASDGTLSGTRLVRDIRPGEASSEPQKLTNVNGALYFVADDGVHSAELWRSDGTESGTSLVEDINRAEYSISLNSESDFALVNGSLFFEANDGMTGAELWKSDGTADGTRLIKDAATLPEAARSSRPDELTKAGDYIYFVANDGAHGMELWRTDGTSDGTELVGDVNPNGHSAPAELTVVGDILYFVADDGEHGREIWRVSSTGSPVRVTDFSPSNASPGQLAEVGGILYFGANDGLLGRELWRTDGTPEGTLRVADIAEGTSSSGPFALSNIGGTLFFAPSGENPHEFELWKSDGTESGTIRLKTILRGIGDPLTQIIDVQGTAFFRTPGGELWISDGTTEGTILLRSFVEIPGGFSWNIRMVSINGTLFFAADDGIHGLELWKSNGTPEGTILVKDIAEGDEDGMPLGLTSVNGTLFFMAEDAVHGTELWKSDGTASGTVLVDDITPGFEDSNVEFLTNIEGLLFFAVESSPFTSDLWQSDGTAEGTALVYRFGREYAGGRIRDLATYRDRLLVAAPANAGQELYVGQLPAISGDYNGDRHLDGTDFLAWQRAVGTLVHPAGSGADGDGSGIVDAGDLAVWVAQWETIPETESAAAAAADREFPSAPPTADQDPAAIADALFAAGDFTSLFNSAPDPLRPRSYRPPRRG